jgi:hypothetical protein
MPASVFPIRASLEAGRLTSESITVNLPAQGNLELQILTVRGALLIHKQWRNVGQGTGTLSFGTGIPPGIYIVRLRSKTGIWRGIGAVF